VAGNGLAGRFRSASIAANAAMTPERRLLSARAPLLADRRSSCVPILECSVGEGAEEPSRLVPADVQMRPIDTPRRLDAPARNRVVVVHAEGEIQTLISQLDDALKLPLVEDRHGQ